MRSMLFAVLLSVVATGAAAGSVIDFSHPDQSYQELAFGRVANGQYEDAARYFRLAANFADKPSQLALAIMHDEGIGMPVDKVAAYAWSDVAAERGYPQFLIVRERIWAELDAAGQARALALGATLYREFGDAVAKPRLEARLQRGLARATGSRTGAVDESLQVGVVRKGYGRVVPGQLGGSAGALAGLAAASSRVRDYYATYRWKPVEYWARVDEVWLPTGKVSVGELQKVQR
ncbi:MAG: hypothetical protein ABIP49_10665 [Lysobacterales bacterium]